MYIIIREKMVSQLSHTAKISTRPPLPSEALAQFSINGTVETIAREDIDPESDNAVIKAKVTAVNTPVGQGIQNGRVAALKGRFDGLAERENKDSEMKRLQRSCFKPTTPGSAKKGSKLGRRSKNSTNIDKNQPSILYYCRGGEGS